MKSFHCALINLILSAEQIQVGKKGRLFGSLAILVQIKLSDTFQSELQTIAYYYNNSTTFTFACS